MEMLQAKEQEETKRLREQMEADNNCSKIRADRRRLKRCKEVIDIAWRSESLFLYCQCFESML